MVEPYRPGLAERLLGDLFRFVNRRIVWHRLGFLLSVVNLVALRTNLRRFNLYDTETREPEAPSPGSRDVRATRTPNGSYDSWPTEHGDGRHAVQPQCSRRQHVPRSATAARPQSAAHQPQAADARRLHPGCDPQRLCRGMGAVHGPRLVQPRQGSVARAGRAVPNTDRRRRSVPAEAADRAAHAARSDARPGR